MPQFCAAIGCTNSSTKAVCRARNVSFHRFPKKNKFLLQNWLLKLRRANFNPGSGSLLCSDHFNDDDFFLQPFTGKRMIKKDAVPSKFTYEVTTRTRKRKVDDSDADEFSDSLNNSPAKNEPLRMSGNLLNMTENSAYMDLESKEMSEEAFAAILDVSMNEKFYRPGHLQRLVSRGNASAVLRQELSSRILLRTLQRQLLEAEVRSANLRRDYYERKKSLLPHLTRSTNREEEDDMDMEEFEELEVLRAQLLEDQVAAKVEKRILRSELLEAEVRAAAAEKEYRKSKNILSKC